MTELEKLKEQVKILTKKKNDCYFKVQNMHSSSYSQTEKAIRAIRQYDFEIKKIEETIKQYEK